MTHTYDARADRGELDIVLIDDLDADDQYVLCPLYATDAELQTMWIRASARDFVSLRDER